VPACIDCHDLKDRFAIGNWSVYLLAPTLKGCESPLATELLVALGAAMPERYRFDIRADEILVRLRPLAIWTTDELVAGVLSATTTEARLCLTKALALTWDWRNREVWRNPGWIAAGESRKICRVGDTVRDAVEVLRRFVSAALKAPLQLAAFVHSPEASRRGSLGR
jgi:hypothetical protein